ncbi:hypothetical protein V6N13_083035 [Hibiscus sabdariffa]
MWRAKNRFVYKEEDCQRADGKEANNGDGFGTKRGKLRSDSKEDICVDHKGVQLQQERSEERGGVDLVGERSVSIFVENIPTRMHWKGLWHLFARHGDVFATYIDRKLSRGGKLTVKLAIQKERNVASKKRHQSSLDGTEDPTKSRSRSDLDFKATPSVMPTKKISGHVENEDLWWLKRCLVEEMATICSVRSITSRLEQWGLNGIKFHRMGGKTFLLSFEDDELYIMLEDLNWSYLKEIFSTVEAWSENFIRPHRATWIEVLGLPLHCWNEVTLQRIVEAFGENVNGRLDCEKSQFLF